MTNEEFLSLDIGDIVGSKINDTRYIVTANYGNRVTAVNTIDITNPSEFILASKAIRNSEKYHQKVSESPRIETGLIDSNGKVICIGDRVRVDVTCNTQLHGTWAIYEVKLRGIVPIISYVTSKKGDVLPLGYLACPLSDKYDQDMFLWSEKDLHDVFPKSNLVVIL